jgi:DnaJ-class molecular chaperone
MANSKKVKRKYICPTCKGNGYLKITYPEEMIQQCWDCDSQGELYEYEDEEFE